MEMRTYFDKKLNELHHDVLKIGQMVANELVVALEVLYALDAPRIGEVIELDQEINDARFALEQKCTALIATQQPTARDVRRIIAVINIIVDLERMGDQAKSIAKIVSHIQKFPSSFQPDELKRMSELGLEMLNTTMRAYTESNISLAESVAIQDDKIDKLYADLFSRIITYLANTTDESKVEASYEILRGARNLERFGDLATNIAERVIYMVTGRMTEINSETLSSDT